MPQGMRLLPFIVLLTLTTSLVGCVAPGSAVTQVGFTGQLKDATGKSLGNTPIQICLPATYGLAGLDASMGKPGDYGHRDQWVSLTTDADGRFKHEFEPVTYSVSQWLFPPLGPSPKEPPKPVLGLRTSLGGNRWFIVYVEGDSSRALRFREQPVEHAALPDNVAKPSLSLRPRDGDRPAGWIAEVTAVRP